jgi:hypothetical protein
MAKLPTDLQILDAVFEAYHDSFTAQPFDERSVIIPIDVSSIANKLNVDRDLVLGRLYFYLSKLHDREGMPLFTLTENENNAVNFHTCRR